MKALFKSFTQILKSNGTRAGPCRTPQRAFSRE